TVRLRVVLFSFLRASLCVSRFVWSVISSVLRSRRPFHTYRKETKKGRLYENRQRLPNALRALPRMAQIPASQGEHARRLGPREPPFAEVGRQIHSPAALFCPLRSYRPQCCDCPDGPDHASVARGVWLQPRPVAPTPRD